ncbi:MAG: tRNA (adenosine(37)-N6)-threonylcarbamoyltransferase complex ATPase subunit type 1 TsaE [Myxococcota bacterium]
MSRPTDPSPDLPRCSWRFPSPTATLAAGAALARAFAEAEAAGELDGPLVVALAGPLGAGKTQLAKGVGAGFGYAPGDLASPTFTIANGYPLPGGGELLHVDAYRLAGPEELRAAGFDDALEPGRVVVVEWPERVAGALPDDRLDIVLSLEAGAAGLVADAPVGDDSAPAGAPVAARRAEARARGRDAARVLVRMRSLLDAVRGAGRDEDGARDEPSADGRD